jgi:hypothetical protein
LEETLMYGKFLSAALAFVAIAGLGLPAVSAEPLSAGEVAAAIGFTGDDKNKVLAGKVAAADLPETTDKMLSQAIAVLLPVKIDVIAERLRSLESLEGDKTVIAYGTIDPVNPEAGLAKAIFADSEAKEAAKFLKASPGSEFNLSAEEFAKVKAAAGDGSPAAASKVYQGLLAERVKAYAAKGLSGIAPYDRGDGETASAGEDLEAMTKALTYLQKETPSLYQAILNYPQDKPSGVTERFTWEKRTVEDRPTFTLVHRMIVDRPDLLVVIVREFYVGHSYNASQSVSGGFPVSEGTLVISGNRSTTDQVAGFMSGTRHSIGRGMMRDELVDKFKRLRSEFAK